MCGSPGQARAVVVAEVLAGSLWEAVVAAALCWRKAHSLARSVLPKRLPLQLASSALKDLDRTLTHSPTHAHRAPHTCSTPCCVLNLNSSFSCSHSCHAPHGPDLPLGS